MSNEVLIFFVFLIKLKGKSMFSKLCWRKLKKWYITGYKRVIWYVKQKLCTSHNNFRLRRKNCLL